jgi:hypothetical protein
MVKAFLPVKGMPERLRGRAFALPHFPSRQAISPAWKML